MGAGVMRAFMTVVGRMVTTARAGRAHALIVAQRGVEDRWLVLLLRDRGVLSALPGHLSWVEYEHKWDGMIPHVRRTLRLRWFRAAASTLLVSGDRAADRYWCVRSVHLLAVGESLRLLG